VGPFTSNPKLPCVDSSHRIIRPSISLYANSRSAALIWNRRLNSSNSKSMSWKESASARRVSSFSFSIETRGSVAGRSARTTEKW